MVSRNGHQIIKTHILPNISRSKDNTAQQPFFFKNHGENEVGRLALDNFLFLKNASYKLKQVVSTLILIYFGRSWLVHETKTNFLTYQTDFL